MLISMVNRSRELDVPLHKVTFVVLDLETTGMRPESCGITEIGAVKYRGGELQGSLATLVDPGSPIPPVVVGLTGITDAMLEGAPPMAAVLPSLLEFLGDGVLVGHNVSFDRSFLDAALVASERTPLPNLQIDTLGLARRLVADEVTSLRLSSLARHLRVARLPCHRALRDAEATADVLHALLERVASFGVLTLEALMAFIEGRLAPTDASIGAAS